MSVDTFTALICQELSLILIGWVMGRFVTAKGWQIFKGEIKLKYLHDRFSEVCALSGIAMGVLSLRDHRS